MTSRTPFAASVSRFSIRDRHRYVPKTATSGWLARMYSARWLPAKPVMPVMSTRIGDPLAITVPRPLSAILPALPLDLGTDLSLFGVSSADLATAGPAISTDPDPNFVVDDNGLDCPTATYTSIQAAVSAAPPGTRIRVCAGTYTEQVTIPAGKDGLLLYSTPDLAAVIKAPATMTDPKAIVLVRGAHNVTIRHFTITGPGSTLCDSLR